MQAAVALLRAKTKDNFNAQGSRNCVSPAGGRPCWRADQVDGKWGVVPFSVNQVAARSVEMQPRGRRYERTVLAEMVVEGQIGHQDDSYRLVAEARGRPSVRGTEFSSRHGLRC